MAYLAGFRTLTTETRDAELEWLGEPPAWLNGLLLRTGPAKFEVGKTSYRHWFDRLAMLHRFAFADRRVRYANRFLQSGAYKDAIAQSAIAREEFATGTAGPVWSKVLAGLTGRVGSDNGSVNVLAYGDHDTVALTETPYPLPFDPRTLETLGAFQWTDELKCQVTTAHPHYDAARRLIYNLEIVFGRKSLYRFTRMTPGSHERSAVAEIETSEPAYTHSFAEAEDDGVLLSVVLDCEGRRSFLLVLDSATMQEHARAYAPHVIAGLPNESNR